MNKKIFVSIAVGTIVLIAGMAIFASQSSNWKPDASENPFQTTSSASAKSKPKTKQWRSGGVAISGKLADAEIVELKGGKFRMYYSAEPETSGFEGQVYSAISSDGITWQPENGVRKKWAVFPSVIKLADGKYRMYFQSSGSIKSATSADGLNWTDDAGTRVDTANDVNVELVNVAAPTVIKIGDSYVMVYRGTINQKYPAKVPNNDTQLLLWATSKDGLKFSKQGIALDSRNAIFNGLLDGPESIAWDDGSIRLYFWSYRGVYHTDFTDGKFSSIAQFDYTNNANRKNHFPENPPGDPTLAYINKTWFMYFGQHGKGIYYATLK